MIDLLEYNSTREKLIMPEYGRNVQKMVEACCQIENRDERNQAAKTIITAMIQLQGFKNEPNEEQLHKLWDHLFIISELRLDVDSPFDKPEPEETDLQSPQRPTYNTEAVNPYRSYGRNMKGLADAISRIENVEYKKMLTFNLANHLKKSYLQWNRDSVTDDVIINQLRVISSGKLDLPDNTTLMTTAAIMQLYQNELMVQGKNGKKVEEKVSKNKKKKKKNKNAN